MYSPSSPSISGLNRMVVARVVALDSKLSLESPTVILPSPVTMSCSLIHAN